MQCRGLTWSREKAVWRVRQFWATKDCHSSRKKKSALRERQPKKSIVSATFDPVGSEWRYSSLPTAADTRSSTNALKGAHPVPGPIRMAGLPVTLLRDRVPGTAHTGTVGRRGGSREASQEEQTPWCGGRGGKRG